MPRKIIYAKHSFQIYEGKKALTADEAKKFLGWEVLDDKAKDHLLTDLEGKKIACNNNLRNRKLVKKNIARIQQDILNKRWRYNSEPRIIGKTGLVIDGQHTLIALVLAEQEWSANREKWSQWKTAPRINTLVTFGLSESLDVMNTINTGLPRTLADALCINQVFKGKGIGRKENVKLSKMLQNAIKAMWERTRGKWDAWAPYTTHAEYIAFLDRHPRLIEAVRLVYEADGARGLRASHLTPGTTAAFMYLMASSKSDATKYHEEEHEDCLDFSLWDRASDFVSEIGGRSKNLAVFRKAMADVYERGNGTRQERDATLIKAWFCFLSEKAITSKALQLEYIEDEGFLEFGEEVTIGGIDLGPFLNDVPPDHHRTVAAEEEKTKSKTRKEDK